MSADPLEALAQEVLPTVPEPGKWPSGAARGIQKISYTHDALIDLIIANPSISQNELAAHFGYSASWVSQIISSDAFQARLADRRDEIVDPAIRASVEEQFRGLVFRSLDILRTKLARPAEAIPDNLALRTLELSSRALGYGAKEQGPAVATQEMHIHLDTLGERLVNLIQTKRAEPPIDGELVNEKA